MNLQPPYRPLADRMRPTHLEGYFGQQHLLGQRSPLRAAIEEGRLHSMLFWGPPGTGKTTLAKLIAHQSGAAFIELSAVLSGVKDIRQAVEQARQLRESTGQVTLLFVDEVHRFNKSQQDAFLPHVENGTIILIGATTENPSFELNNALLSRVRVYVLKSLAADDIRGVVQHAIQTDAELQDRAITIDDDALEYLVLSADGDARRVLNWLEIAADLATVADTNTDEAQSVQQSQITLAIVQEIATDKMRRFDKGGDVFYEQISALHKSVRGSHPDAALYWLCRMLDGGCDPLYIARRVVRMASEDIGNADPRGLQVAMDAWQSYERLGSPEGELAIAQAVAYLACAPKSNAVYMAYKAAMSCVKQSDSQAEVPFHLRNAPTALMKQLDYGKDYRYAHDEENAYAAGESYFPESVGQPQFYHPVERGLETKIKAKLDWFRGLDKQSKE